ncbi:MAG: hypothetical protein KAS32_22260 [Candidatus Peribacteraceae bacterium]|nr:hypothetical protein [Candidatus Peribacteraceae bacterium]
MRSKDLFSSFGQQRILGGATTLAVCQISASIAGLFRDRFLSSTFPELGVVDVYIAAFRPSDLLFQMMIMAGFSVALVPLLASYKANDNKEKMSDLLSSVLTVFSIGFGFVALLSAIFFPLLAPLFTQFEGEMFSMYISFGRIALFTNFLFVFGNAFGQYLITSQRYWIYGLTPFIYTLGTIFGTLFLTPSFGAFGPIFGTLLGSVFYVLLRFFAVIRVGYRPKLLFWHSDLSEMFWLMLPRVIALGTLQAELLLFDRIASGLEIGSVTINAYARNFQSVVIGVAGVALAQSAFSLLSQAASKSERKRFVIYVKKGITLVLILTIPGAIILSLSSPIAARLVSLTHVLPVFSVCLLFYAISIPFESVNHLLLRSFYSLKQTAWPAALSVVNGSVAILIAFIFAPDIGVYALAIGFTAGQVVQMLGLVVLLPIQIKRRMIQ